MLIDIKDGRVLTRSDIEVLRVEVKKGSKFKREALIRVMLNIAVAFCMMLAVEYVMASPGGVAAGGKDEMANIFIAIIGVYCVGLSGIIIVWGAIQRIEGVRSLEYASKEAYLVVDEWLDVPRVKSYIEKVRAEGRDLVNVEVDRLQEWSKEYRDSAKAGEAYKRVLGDIAGDGRS